VDRSTVSSRGTPNSIVTATTTRHDLYNMRNSNKRPRRVLRTYQLFIIYCHIGVVDLRREGIKRKQLVAAIPMGNNCRRIPEKGESWRKQQILIKLFIFIGNNNGICLNFENITSVLSRIRKTHGRTKIGKL